MKKSNRGGYGGQSWKQLERIMALGRSRGDVFGDWLDLMLEAQLSATDNLARGNRDAQKWDGPHETAYLDIIARYPSNREIGERPIDHFCRAMAELVLEIEATGQDCLGDIFESEITYGEHGQFFTPEAVADMIAAIVPVSEEGDRQVFDPACGSGRLLLASHKNNRNAFMVGCDLDPRCTKMFALNMLFRGISGDAYNGNSLSLEMNTLYRVRGGFVTEVKLPKATPAMKDYAEKQGKLF